MSDYFDIIIQTYSSTGEQSKHNVRAHPIVGQGFPTDMKVECSTKMRDKYPVGTKFKISAKIKDTINEKPHLYSHHNSSYQIMSDEEVDKFIAKHYL